MGCATSKQKKKKEILCENCQAPYLPVRRSYSMHHPQKEIETNNFHVVALTSSTLGSLKLDFFDHKHCIKEEQEQEQDEFVMGSNMVEEAKTWSKMIDQKITKIPPPKTPTTTPPGEPETIDAWELMSGLENTSPLLLKHHIRSFSFHLASHHTQSFDDVDYPTPKIQEKPILVKREKLVVYFTSLRGVRKTYEDCCNVRGILKGLKVKIDERDVSMHSGFKDELKDLLGEEWYKGGSLPKVFIGRRYIGGVEEIRRMHEEGRLEKAVEGCESVVEDDGGEDGGISGGVCEACGDVRFVPCDNCCGSCKIYYEGEGDYNEEYKECDYGFQRCPNCNENGLVRCPICCDS